MMNEVPSDLAAALAVEVCKDLDYYDIYKLAEKQMQEQFRNRSYEELLYEYEERYDYIFYEPNANV